jgi:hypothetical protein
MSQLAHRSLRGMRDGLPQVAGGVGTPRSQSSGMTPYAKGWVQAFILTSSIFLVVFLFNYNASGTTDVAVKQHAVLTPDQEGGAEPLLVSYSYFEKDEVQRSNMEFFMAAGMGIKSLIPAPSNTEFVIVISGDTCSPCTTLMPLVLPVPDISHMPQLSKAWESTGGNLAILQRVVSL